MSINVRHAQVFAHVLPTTTEKRAMHAVPPELDADALREKYAPQFEVAENLQAYAWERRPQGGTGGKRYRSLIFAIFARATLTYRAVLHLCRGGYTEQADMLRDPERVGHILKEGAVQLLCARHNLAKRDHIV